MGLRVQNGGEPAGHRPADTLIRVDRQGNPKGMRIVRNDTSAVTAEFTVKAILDAEIPPMPADVAALLGERGLEIDYRVLLY